MSTCQSALGVTQHSRLIADFSVGRAPGGADTSSRTLVGLVEQSEDPPAKMATLTAAARPMALASGVRRAPQAALRATIAPRPALFAPLAPRVQPSSRTALRPVAVRAEASVQAAASTPAPQGEWVCAGPAT